MDRLNLNETKRFYENANNVWANSCWYKYSYKAISNYLHENTYLNKCKYILNAGSAGNNYGFSCRMHHLDIAENKINTCKEYTVGSIERTSFQDCYFDGIICVGSVINYTDAIESISEMIRIVDHNGIIVLEFENSNSFEYLFTPNYKKDAKLIKTLYLGENQSQWIYSYDYIISILQSYENIKILDITGFHIVDAFFANHEKFASFFSKYDAVFDKITAMKKHASNIILTIKKL